MPNNGTLTVRGTGDAAELLPTTLRIIALVGGDDE